MKSLIVLILMFSYGQNGIARESVITLVCKAMENILIQYHWNYSSLPDYMENESKTFLITIKEDELSINDYTIKNTQQKFESISGYDESSYFSSRPTNYEAGYFYSINEQPYSMSKEQKIGFRLVNKGLRINRLNARFTYEETFYLRDISQSVYSKFNKDKLTDGFVLLRYDGKCVVGTNQLF